MTVFKKKPFMYKLGARLFEWMRDCALYMKFNKYTGKYMPEDSDFDSPVFAVMFGIGLVAVIVVFILAICGIIK